MFATLSGRQRGDTPAQVLGHARQERDLPQFRDAEFEIAGLGRQHLRPGPVAVIDAVDAAFPRVGADLAGCFAVDQLLSRPLSELADQISAFPDRDIETNSESRS